MPDPTPADRERAEKMFENCEYISEVPDGDDGWHWEYSTDEDEVKRLLATIAARDAEIERLKARIAEQDVEIDDLYNGREEFP